VRSDQRPAQDITAAGNLGDDFVEEPMRKQLGEKSAGRRTVPAYSTTAGRHERRGQDRRYGIYAHHQRTNRGVARLRTRQEKDEKIAVYDLGGSTFDISVLRLATKRRRMATRTSAVTTGTRASWIDHQWVQKGTGIDLSKQPDGSTDGKAEKAKIALSSTQEV
jgi:hypothetical protein